MHCLVGTRRETNLTAREAVVRDEPLLAAAIAPQPGAREEEDAPLRGGRTPDDAVDLGAVRVELLEPRLRGARVVRPRYAPVLLELQVAVEAREKIVRRHRPGGEETTRHPAGVVRVRVAVVRENVAEEASVGL